MIDIQLKTYIDRLKKQILNVPFINYLNNDGDLTFQRVMFFLVQKILGFKDNNNYQIIVGDVAYETDILSEVVLSIALTKYFNTHQQELPEVCKGDILYKYATSCEYEVMSKTEDSIFCQKRTIKKHEIPARISISKHQIGAYILIPKKEEFKWNRNTLQKRFKDYLDFFEKYKPQNIDFKPLTKFDTKTLIIANSKVREDLAYIPYRYKGMTDNLPIEPMIELVKDWEEAKEILEKDDKIQEIIIIGKQKYQDNINNIINFNNRSDTYRKLILIGDRKADTNASFNMWHWTLEELWLLYNITNPSRLLRQSIKDKFLLNAFDALRNVEEQLVTEGVVKRYVEQTLRNLFTPFLAILNKINEEQVEIFKDKLNNKLDDYNDNFQIICYNAGLKNKDFYKCEILKIFEGVVDYLKSNNTKLDYCKKLHLNNYVQYKIVCKKSDCETLNENFKKEDIRRTKAISVKELEDIVLEKANLSNNTQTHFIFHYIYLKYENPSWYYYLLQKARAFGNVTLLEYEGVEQERNNAFSKFYEREKEKRLTATDRLKFIDIPYESKKEEYKLAAKTVERSNNVNNMEYEIKQNKDFFAQFCVFDEDIKTVRDVIEFFDDEEYCEKTKTNKLGANKTKCKINLENGNEIECSMTDVLVMPKGNTFVEKRCDSLYSGENILYFDINFENCFEVLKKIDNKGLKETLKKIIEASHEWRKWLRNMIEIKAKSKERKVAEEEVYRIIKPSVGKATFLSWITDKHEYFFPRSNDDLKAILDYYPRLKIETATYIERANEIFSLKRTNTGLREVVTKLNIELGQYICDKSVKPKLEILSKLNETQIKELTKTKQIVKIIEITKIIV